MSTLSFSQTLPLETGWDVIVAGGGPAGCAAALAAAREGARTLLLEQTQCLGGAAVNMLVPKWCPFSDLERFIYSGLGRRIFNASVRGSAHATTSMLPPIPSNIYPPDTPLDPETMILDWVPINPEHLKRVYDDLAAQYGVQVAFQTTLAGAVRKPNPAGGDDVIEAVVVATKDGLKALQAKVFIDCTGDGDLCAFAGVPYEKEDPQGGKMNPATHCFIIANVDDAAMRRIVDEDRPLRGSPEFDGRHPRFLKIYDTGRYPEIKDNHMGAVASGPGTYTFNAGHIYNVDGSNPADVSKCPPEGRRIAEAYHRACKESAPEAFAHSNLVTTAPQIGFRETRRIVGDYTLTLDDWAARRKFADEICRSSYPPDIHTLAAEAKFKTDVDAMDRFGQYGPGETHGIPYRCLTAKGVANLMMAGRNISCDHYVQAAIRVMPPAIAMGEAAGIAAVLAGKAGDAVANVHAVDAQAVRQRMREEGAYLP